MLGLIIVQLDVILLADILSAHQRLILMNSGTIFAVYCWLDVARYALASSAHATLLNQNHLNVSVQISTRKRGLCHKVYSWLVQQGDDRLLNKI